MEETNNQAKKKKPIFKKWWFWVIIGVVALIIIGTMLPNSSKDDEPSALEKFDLELARDDWSDLLDKGVSNIFSFNEWTNEINAYKNNASTPSITILISGGDSIGKGAQVGDRGTRTYTVKAKIGKTTYDIGSLVLLIECGEVLLSGDIKVGFYSTTTPDTGNIGYGVESAEVTRAFPWETINED